MGTQATSTTKISSRLISDKVMRSYQVVLKCASQTQREEINNRIRRIEEKQTTLLTPDVVKKAVEILRKNSSLRNWKS